MNTHSRYPRLIPSFVELAQQEQPHRSTVPSSDAAKLEAGLQRLVRPLQPKRLDETIQEICRRQRYCAIGKGPKQLPEWRSFDDKTGSWVECSANDALTTVVNALRSEGANLASTAVHHCMFGQGPVLPALSQTRDA